MRVTGSQLFFVIICGAALIASLFVRAILPERFLLDDMHIQQVIHDPEVSPENTSFQLIAAFYRGLGLGSAPEAVGLLGIAVLVVAIGLAVGFERLSTVGVVDTVLIGAALVVGLAYLAQYSKELITVVLVAVVLLCGGRRGGDVVIVLACLVYALTMRPYWAIVAGLYLGWRYFLPRVRNPLWLPVIALVVYVLAQPVFVLALGTNLDDQRTWLNDERADTEVATLITNPLPGDGPVPAVLGTLITLLTLVVPVGLLGSGAVYHMAAGALILGLWGLTLFAIATGACRRDLGDTGFGGTHSAGPTRARRTRTSAALDRFDAEDALLRIRAGSLLLALLVVQAMFEPDYGSYLKHLAPMLPLMIAVVVRHPRSRTNRLLRASRRDAALLLGGPVALTVPRPRAAHSPGTAAGTRGTSGLPSSTRGGNGR